MSVLNGLPQNNIMVILKSIKLTHYRGVPSNSIISFFSNYVFPLTLLSKNKLDQDTIKEGEVMKHNRDICQSWEPYRTQKGHRGRIASKILFKVNS